MSFLATLKTPKKMTTFAKIVIFVVWASYACVVLFGILLCYWISTERKKNENSKIGPYLIATIIAVAQDLILGLSFVLPLLFWEYDGVWRKILLITPFVLNLAGIKLGLRNPQKRDHFRRKSHYKIFGRIKPEYFHEKSVT